VGRLLDARKDRFYRAMETLSGALRTKAVFLLYVQYHLIAEHTIELRLNGNAQTG
jgi:hypothetical protein